MINENDLKTLLYIIFGYCYFLIDHQPSTIKLNIIIKLNKKLE